MWPSCILTYLLFSWVEICRVTGTMAKRGAPHRHHYIPRMILRNFVNAEAGFTFGAASSRLETSKRRLPRTCSLKTTFSTIVGDNGERDVSIEKGVRENGVGRRSAYRRSPCRRKIRRNAQASAQMLGNSLHSFTTIQVSARPPGTIDLSVVMRSWQSPRRFPRNRDGPMPIEPKTGRCPRP